MNVACTQCQTVFRVDPAKVPEAGVRARCSVCAGIFWVRRESELTPPAPEVTQAVAETRTPAAPIPVQAPAPAPSAVVPPAPQPAPMPRPVVPRASQATPAWTAPPAVAPASAPPTAVPPFRPVTPPAPAFRAPAPSAPAAPVARPTPAAAVAPAQHAAPSIQSPARRPTNPFLSQDPEARARRLARALVSDIVVYHPAKRRDALRDGSLKLLFEEEIRKSWDEYVDQVGRELADATTFFTDALNEILADGQPVFP